MKSREFLQGQWAVKEKRVMLPYLWLLGLFLYAVLVEFEEIMKLYLTIINLYSIE